MPDVISPLISHDRGSQITNPIEALLIVKRGEAIFVDTLNRPGADELRKLSVKVSIHPCSQLHITRELVQRFDIPNTAASGAYLRLRNVLQHERPDAVASSVAESSTDLGASGSVRTRKLMLSVVAPVVLFANAQFAVALPANEGQQALSSVHVQSVGSRLDASSNRELTSRLGANKDVRDLTLVKSIDGTAIVRFGAGPLEKVTIGDRLGKTSARVREITLGRMVLGERFVGTDGQPNVAQIILKDGETGGTRYVRRLEDKPPPVVRPVVIDPKPRSKKP